MNTLVTKHEKYRCLANNHTHSFVTSKSKKKKKKKTNKGGKGAGETGVYLGINLMGCDLHVASLSQGGHNFNK